MIEVLGVQPTAKELRPAYRLWPALAFWGRINLIWIGALTLGTIWLTRDVPGPVELWIIGSQCLLLYGVIGLGFLAQNQIGRMARDLPTGKLAMDWRMDEQGLRVTTALTDRSVDWRGVARIGEEKDRWIFAVGPSRNHVLPKRVLGPGQAAALATLIAEVRVSGRLGAGVDYPPPPSDKA